MLSGAMFPPTGGSRWLSTLIALDPMTYAVSVVRRGFHGTALQECWRPAFHRRRFDRLTQLRAELDSWLVTYNTRRKNHSDFMRGRTPRQVLDTHPKNQAA